MIEIETLIPEPVPLNTRGGILPVYPLRVRQFGAMLRALEPVLHTFRQATREVDLPALLERTDDVCRIIAVGLDTTEQQAAALTWENHADALLMVIGVNEDFLFPPAAGESAAEGDAAQPDTMADTFQRLIESGHRWQDIQDYTLAQVQAFGAAAARLQRERDKTALLTARAAASDAQVFSTWLNALDGKAATDGE